MSNETAGIGDPYWFEWSVGLIHVLDMLDEANDIDCVTMQDAAAQGLDDVVVSYRSGNVRRIQVKHTREGDSLTFADLTSGLLQSLAKAWKEAVDSGQDCTPELYTNRAVSRRWATSKVEKLRRPPLSEFWPHLRAKLGAHASVATISMPADWADGWVEWKAQLTDLSEAEQLNFLKRLIITTDSPGLQETESILLQRLQALFGCSEAQSRELLDALNSALRRWTTTLRGNNTQITPDGVQRALHLATEASGTRHLIAPPEPFFPSRLTLLEDLRTRLTSRATPIVLLTGGPGCGKTSIVSMLANGAQPLVSARYHAYRPITPDTQHLPPDADADVSARGMWGSLLSQLRHLLAHRLSHYRVPIRNQFLSVEQLRAETLRLASAIGLESAKTFVIAIDGIDHAARASHSNDALQLLRSLPSTTEVPANVAILVAGQPPEAWPQYPLELREPTSSVARINVPSLTEADVRALVEERANAAPDLLDVLVRIVAEAAKGDTLAAVFAAEEARTESDPGRLLAHLQTRRLSSGIQRYDEAIWNAVTEKLGGPGTLAAMRLAVALAHFDQRLSGALLDRMFPTPAQGADVWEDALLSLRPLVVWEGSGYRLTHNDVRVFLTRVVAADASRARLAISRLADFCLHDQAAGISRFTIGFDLLRSAGRAAEVPRNLTSRYVGDAWRAGIDLSLLQAQCRRVLGEANTFGLSWSELHGLVGALHVTELIDSSTSSLAYSTTALVTPDSRVPLPALLAECRVVPMAAWSPGDPEAALRDAIALVDNGQRNRARGLMRRWFTDLTPLQLSDIIRGTSEHPTRDVAEDALRLFGRASHGAGIERLAQPGSKLNDDEMFAWAAYHGGYAADAADRGGPVAWARALRRMVAYSPDWLLEQLTELADRGRWLELAIGLDQFAHARGGLGSMLQARAAVWALQLGEPGLVRGWSQPIVNNPFRFNRDQLGWDQAPKLCAAQSFVLGWMTTRPAESIREDALKAHGAHHSGERAMSALSSLFHAAALIGGWIGRPRTSSMVPEEARRLATYLLTYQPPAQLRHTSEIAAQLFQGLCEAARRAGPACDDIVHGECVRYASAAEFGDVTPHVWRVLASREEWSRLATWLDARLGPDGTTWRHSTQQRLRELQMFARLAGQVEAFSSRAQLLIEKQRAVALGHVIDDDVSLVYVHRWFEALTAVDASAWQTEGPAVLAASREADRGGDNEYSDDIEGAVVAAAIRCGPASWKGLEKAVDGSGNNWFGPSSRHWLEGLLDALPSLQLNQEIVRSAWSLCLGRLPWRYDRDVNDLSDVAEVLERCATSQGLSNEIQTIASTSRLEWHYAHALDPGSTRRRRSRASQDEPNTTFDFNRASIEDSIAAARDGLTAVAERRHKAWPTVEVLARRIAREKPANMAHVALQLAELVDSRREMPNLRWRHEGLRGIFVTLAPLLDDKGRAWLLHTILDRVSPSRSRYLSEVAEDLDVLCLAMMSSTDDLRAGLGRHLEAHAQMIESSRTLDRPTFPIIDGKEAITWTTHCVDLLLQTLGSDSGTLNHSALLGLATIGHLLPESLSHLAISAPRLEREDRLAIAELAEHIACALPAEAVRLEPFLQDSATCGHLEVELQSWIARCAHARATGSSFPTFKIDPRGQTRGRTSSQKLVEEARTANRYAYPTTATQAALSAIKYLEWILDGDAERLESLLATSLAQDPPEPILRTECRRPSDMQYLPSAQVRRLLDLLRTELALPDRGGAAIRLAQAILHQDDPAIAFGNWHVLPNWPREDETVRSVRQRDVTLSNRLQDLLSTDLKPDEEVVFAGMIRTPAERLDVVLEALPLVTSQTDLVRGTPRTTTIGGRTFALFDEQRFERDEGVDELPMHLAFAGRGTQRTPTQSLGIVPSRRLQTQCGWKPSSSNALRWKARDGSAVRYERIHGPRRARPDLPAFRDPYLERWVCTRAAWDDLEQQFGGSIRLDVSLRVFDEDEQDDQGDQDD